MTSPNFPSNSKSPPPEDESRKVERVIIGGVKSRPKSIGKRLKEALIGGDSKSVIQYVIVEVVIPQVKDMLAEAATQGFERFIFGESRSNSRRSSVRTQGSRYTNYSGYSARGNRPLGNAVREERTILSVRTHNEDELIFQTRSDAQAVLERMYDLLEEYNAVSVADLKAMIEKSSNHTAHTDQKWGWEELSGAEIRRVRDGYLLYLPKTVSLD